MTFHDWLWCVYLALGPILQVLAIILHWMRSLYAPTVMGAAGIYGVITIGLVCYWIWRDSRGDRV